MTAPVQPDFADSDIESVLREELACGDAVVQTIAPILKHFLGSGGNALFTDDVMAGIRGMAGDVAQQLLEALAAASGNAGHSEPNIADKETLTGLLIESPDFLSHLHALAIEWQLTQRLQTRLALDPILQPMVQDMMASADPALSALAMRILAAQVRFCQAQRRMKLPLGELPGDLLHGALLALRDFSGEAASATAAAAEARLRQRYDEGNSRVGLMSQLLVGIGGRAVSALSVTHAGTAMFITALSLSTGQNRDLIALSTNDSQIARLALALRASGLKQQEVEEQFIALHPDIALPPLFDQLSPDRAAAILASAGYTVRM